MDKFFASFEQVQMEDFAKLVVVGHNICLARNAVWQGRPLAPSQKIAHDRLNFTDSFKRASHKDSHFH